MTNETNQYKEFQDTMADILSSGNGIEFLSWHRKELKKLFKTIKNRDVLVDYLNTFYSTVEPHEMLEGELDEVAELINGTVKKTILFQ